MRYIYAILLLAVAGSALAQQGRDLRPIFVSGGNFKNSGWFFSPGIASMMPTPRSEQLTGYDSQSVPDTLYSGEFSRDGGLGLYLEAGRHHFVRWGPIHHVDYGLSYKMLRGTEEFQGVLRGDTGAFASYAANASFNDSYLGAFGNLSNMIQLSNRFWIQNSLKMRKS